MTELARLKAGASTVGPEAGSGGSKGERTRARLLDAAAAEVARHGATRASIGAIAAAAGLQTGSVYFHFASKDQLIAAMLEEGLRVTLSHLDAALAAVADPDDAAAQLRAAIRAHTAAVHELPDYTLAVLAPAFPGDDGPAAPAFQALRRGYVERWTRLVADAQRAGVLAEGHQPRLLRDLIFGALNAVGLGGRSPDEAAAALEALIGLDRAPGGSGAR
jgi:TetR/AcrR family transcriptional regulator, cholesterol catabolism regulator